MLEIQDARGALPLLMLLSGFSAMERRSESVEPCDLIKAIYVADLERVSRYWDDWEGFERFVTGDAGVYLNRVQYMLNVDRMQQAMTENTAFEFGKLSPALQEIIRAARELASKRKGAGASPSSVDLLFSTCARDKELSSQLQSAGLDLAALNRAVQGQK